MNDTKNVLNTAPSDHINVARTRRIETGEHSHANPSLDYERKFVGRFQFLLCWFDWLFSTLRVVYNVPWRMHW